MGKQNVKYSTTITYELLFCIGPILLIINSQIRSFTNITQFQRWCCYGHSVNVTWCCYGHTVNVTWCCYGHAVNVMWCCYGHTVNVTWCCYGHAVNVTWCCYGHTVNVTWCSTSPDSKKGQKPLVQQ